MPAPGGMALRGEPATSVEAAAAAAAAVRGPDGSGGGRSDVEMADAADMLSSLQALSVAGHGPGAPLGPPPPLGVGSAFGGLQPPFAPQARHTSRCKTCMLEHISACLLLSVCMGQYPSDTVC